MQNARIFTRNKNLEIPKKQIEGWFRANCDLHGAARPLATHGTCYHGKILQNNFMLPAFPPTASSKKTWDKHGTSLQANFRDRERCYAWIGALGILSQATASACLLLDLLPPTTELRNLPANVTLFNTGCFPLHSMLFVLTPSLQKAPTGPSQIYSYLKHTFIRCMTFMLLPRMMSWKPLTRTCHYPRFRASPLHARMRFYEASASVCALCVEWVCYCVYV